MPGLEEATLDCTVHKGRRSLQSLGSGLHLLKASPKCMENTIAAFRPLDIQRLAPAHSTGLLALAQLWTAFPGRCFSCAVGACLVFQR